ncbi:hypothetical protein EVAR_5776_1 [Eumeta japonica]|uniref:Uncharacterized protein n=1 Tax=Eumeta variegata TaxID=151549 RepID=A0A4C1T550_EUMVA|nr:hypothetical protein EVAR_5776_1 [Eumeta japonica]
MQAYEALLATLNDAKSEHEAVLTKMYADFLRIFELADLIKLAFDILRCRKKGIGTYSGAGFERTALKVLRRTSFTFLSVLTYFRLGGQGRWRDVLESTAYRRTPWAKVPVALVRGAAPFGADYTVVGGWTQGHPDVETRTSNIEIKDRLGGVQSGPPGALYFLPETALDLPRSSPRS